MGYSYGHPSTAGYGIWLWLQGQSNSKKKDYKGTNYISKNLDINQQRNFVRDVVLKFYKDVLGVEISKKDYNAKQRLRFKIYCQVQDNFTKFTIFVKDNYEPQ